jgi:hypothetical protein
MNSAQSEKYASAAQEDRSAPRTRLSIPATLRSAGGRRLQTVIRDLSLSGFSATAINRIPAGTMCWLTMPDLEAMAAKVIWWEQGLVGCAFEQLLSSPAYEDILARWNADRTYRG